MTKFEIRNTNQLLEQFYTFATLRIFYTNLHCIAAQNLSMTWIEMIEYGDSERRLRKLYDAARNPDGSIDRVLKIHSLRPRTLHAHLVMYKSVLHTKPNELSYRERELVGTFTSYLNGCDYCVQHHKAGLGREINDMDLANKLFEESKQLERNGELLTPREEAMLQYARKLTLNPQKMEIDDIAQLRNVGLSDTTILDLNQIVAYFNYVNRSVNGLGVDIAGEQLGFHPSEDVKGFSHQ